MKFKMNTSDLTAALDLVSIVTPRPMTPQGGAGYLFVVREDRCYLYSRDQMSVARADFPITEVEGEGSFVYPSQYIDAFKYVGDTLTLESETDGVEKFIVRYTSSNGSTGERSSFDPRMLSVCDPDLEKASSSCEIPAGILREAISQGRPFISKPQDTRTEEQFKGMQIFDASKEESAKGDGHLFASNATQAFYFYCELLVGKRLEIHGLHLPAFIAFLAKCTGNITIRRGDHFTFAVSSHGNVFGWPKHAKTHGKFNYYPLKTDKYVLEVPKSLILNALKYTRVELDAKRDKIKVTFDHTKQELLFGVVDGSAKAQSYPIPVTAKVMDDKSFALNVNIDHLMGLIDGTKVQVIELRVAIIPADGHKVLKDIPMFRTIDTFRMTPEGKVVVEPEGSYECRVTRFMPSKD